MPKLCPECGNALPAGTPRGFCPTCLLRGGLALPELETAAFQAVKKPNEEGLESRIMGRYKLGEKLGEGGFGVVYEAHQGGALQRDVAVKVLKSDVHTGQIIARFEAERQALALMDHPGIARVLDAGETRDGRPFFVMEKVNGTSITEYVRTHPLSVEERLRLIITVCEAVHHAHQKGVIHRDIKPSNILITEESGTSQPKVIDFGIAKAVDAPLTKRTLYTQFDQLMGTPGYISPEQVERGAEAIDVRSDVYALGALLYEVLTGSPVVDLETMKGKSLHVALLEIARSDPPRPSVQKPELRGDLDAITLKALATEPQHRYGSASALAEDLQRFLDHQPVKAHVPGRLYLMTKFARRHRFGVAASVALFVCLVALTVTGWNNYRMARQQQEKDARSELEARVGRSMDVYHSGVSASDRGRHSEAMAQLSHALRIDPMNERAATFLLSMLMQVPIGHPVTVQLKPLPGYTNMPHVAVNARLRQALAVCQATGKDAEGRCEVLTRWNLDDDTRQDISLPTGVQVTAFAMSADDETAVLGFSDGSLARYDVAKARLSLFAVKMKGAISALALTADTTAAVVGTATGDVQLWDLDKHESEVAAVNLGGPVHVLACDATASIAAAGSGHDVACLAPRRGVMLSGPQRMSGAVGVLALPPNGSVVAVGQRNGFASMLSLPDLIQRGTPLPHSGPVNTAAFNADGRVLMTGDERGMVATWQTQTVKPMTAMQQLDGAVLLCRPLSQRGQTLAVTQRGELRLWEVLSKAVAQHRTQQVQRAATSHDGTLTALVMQAEPRVHVWEMHTRLLEPRYVSTAPPAAEKCADAGHAVTTTAGHAGQAVLRVGARQITSGQNRRVRITVAESGEMLAPELYHDQPIMHLALTPDERTLLTITADGTHRCWDVLTGDPLTPRWRNGEMAKNIRMSADCTRYYYERPSGGWFELPMPPRDEALPEWFISFVETHCGRRLLSNGTGESVRRDFSVFESTHLADATQQTSCHQLARWLLSSSEERALWPGDSQSFEDYLKALSLKDEPAARVEFTRFRMDTAPPK